MGTRIEDAPTSLRLALSPALSRKREREKTTLHLKSHPYE